MRVNFAGHMTHKYIRYISCICMYVVYLAHHTYILATRVVCDAMHNIICKVSNRVSILIMHTTLSYKPQFLKGGLVVLASLLNESGWGRFSN